MDATGHRLELAPAPARRSTTACADLVRTQPRAGTRRRFRIFPGCSQDPGKRRVTLGTSVGWSDVYPSTYHQQWIDVTGLHGCFAYVHRADPNNHVFESNEGNNDSQRIVRLPFGSERTAVGCEQPPVVPRPQATSAPRDCKQPHGVVPAGTELGLLPE